MAEDALRADRVGIVGVGRMGLAMVKHLAARGTPVIVCDVSEAAVAAACELGATSAPDAAGVAAGASFVILAVGYDEEVNQVVHGAGGALARMGAGDIIAVSSTVAPDTVEAIAAAAAPRGVGVLDAPICRGRFYADSGELLALFGGEEAVLTRGREVYSAFCSDIETVGGVGHGQAAKAINNLMLWITSVGLIEAGRIAESTGIDLPNLRTALMKSSAKSQALEDWDQTSFTWALKDMQIVAKMTDAAGLSLPITGAIKELVKDARRIKATNPPGWTAKNA